MSSPLKKPLRLGGGGGGGGGGVRRKRKLVSSGGQKWFKGSPRKRAHQVPNCSINSTSSGHQGTIINSNNNAACPSSGGDPPTPAIIPALLIQIIVEGVEIRLSVYDQIPILSKEDEGCEVVLSVKKKKSRVSLQALREPEPEPEKPVGVGEGGGSVVEEEQRPLPQPMFQELEEFVPMVAKPLPKSYIRWMDGNGEEEDEEVEYHVDEEDSAWLNLTNSSRDGAKVSLEYMELLMDRLEKESYLQMQSSGLDQRPVIDDDAVCCICMDGECQNSNAILFCDMCNLAVHQECYGVPYIPEGQWLCRRCLQSPSREVECVLCPNKGGAFKQTDDGRWAHVVCAIWIPEVCFANTVFLEPVDSVNNIPPARWRLCCFICKYKGRGACIQCHKSNCYIAFHVTCAQHAGLCMRMDTVRIGSTVTVRKTAFCDNHAPPDYIRKRDVDSPSVRQKLKACRKMLAEKRSAQPTVSVPTIPPERVTEIASIVTFQKKTQFIKKLLSYWKLKRIQRNGVPLLRRLQAATNHPPSTPHSAPLPNSLSATVSKDDDAWFYLIRLRQHLEKARILCQLMRNREKYKRDLVNVKADEWFHSATPFSKFLCSILDALGKCDPQNIFAEPVDNESVPDYLSVIVNPMDLSTMRERATSLYYDSLLEMKLDFELMINNCILYNPKDTIFYRTAIRVRESGEMIFREAERMEKQIGFDPETGFHLEKSHLLKHDMHPVPKQSDEQIYEEMDAFFKDETRHEWPLSQQVNKLQDLIDKVVGVSHPGAKKKRYKKLKTELQRLRRLETPKSPLSPKHSPKHSPKQSPRREPSPKQQPAVISAPTPRKLRRKSVLEAEGTTREDNIEPKIRRRPPKRGVVKVLEATRTPPSRRSSRSVENSPTRPPNLTSVPTTPSNSKQGSPVLRRTTRMSVDSDRVTRTHLNSNASSPKPPLTNGLVKNGRNKNTPNTRRKLSDLTPLPETLSQPPAIDSFSVYRDTERNSSDGEEQEEEDNEDDDVSDEESSSEEEEEDGDSYSSDESSPFSTPRGTPRVTRRGRSGDVSPRLRKLRGTTRGELSSNNSEESSDEEVVRERRVNR